MLLVKKTKWDDIKKEIKCLSEEEKMYVELLADIVTIRHEESLTIRELGKKTGLHHPAIARFENPTKTSNVMTMLKIVNALGYELTIKKKTINSIG
jgi:predicted transcriptional regulator